jgi:hypothetical protein
MSTVSTILTIELLSDLISETRNLKQEETAFQKKKLQLEHFKIRNKKKNAN